MAGNIPVLGQGWSFLPYGASSSSDKYTWMNPMTAFEAP
jgi:hypothetical protein